MASKKPREKGQSATTPSDKLFSLCFLEPEKMPWHVTVIPSYWPAMTLTKPFSAVCALPASLTSKAAKKIWGSSQMPLIHAFDMQAFTVCLLGSVKTHLGNEETHPLLDRLLIMLQKLAGCPCGSDISFQNGRMLFPCIPASTDVLAFQVNELGGSEVSVR